MNIKIGSIVSRKDVYSTQLFTITEMIRNCDGKIACWGINKDLPYRRVIYLGFLEDVIVVNDLDKTK